MTGFDGNFIEIFKDKDPRMRHCKGGYARIIFMQSWYRSSAQKSQYEYASIEYPERYKALLTGFSDKALLGIKSIDISEFTTQLPANLGARFYEQFLLDRAAYYTAQTAYQTALTT